MTYHVAKHRGGWVVRLSGAKRAARRFAAPEAALEWARECLAWRRIVVHRPDGTVDSIITREEA